MSPGLNDDLVPMEWSDGDLVASIITIPAARQKAGTEARVCDDNYTCGARSPERHIQPEGHPWNPPGPLPGPCLAKLRGCRTGLP